MVAGGFDDIAKMRVADMAACRRFLGDAPARAPDIRETRSHAVMECVREARAPDLSHLHGG